MVAIEENVARIRAEIAEAAIRAGRDPAEILLCAASKMNHEDAIQRAIAAGVDVCGENRVQELVEKLEQNAYRGSSVHFIGHLQKNKARFVVGNAALIQSVDSVALLALLNRIAEEKAIRQEILLEINIGAEPAKSGFTPESALAAAEQMEQYPNLLLRGLMAIPPRAENPGDNHRFFAQMQKLYVDMREKKYDNANMGILSMGMSGDFAHAIAFGSTMVRIGTAIFGARDYGTPA